MPRNETGKIRTITATGGWEQARRSAKLACRLGLCQPAVYNLTGGYTGRGLNDVRNLRQLSKEKNKLKRAVTELMVENTFGRKSFKIMTFLP